MMSSASQRAAEAGFEGGSRCREGCADGAESSGDQSFGPGKADAPNHLHTQPALKEGGNVLWIMGQTDRRRIGGICSFDLEIRFEPLP
jgi:hypothetical protein